MLHSTCRERQWLALLAHRGSGWSPIKAPGQTKGWGGKSCVDLACGSLEWKQVHYYGSVWSCLNKSLSSGTHVSCCRSISYKFTGITLLEAASNLKASGWRAVSCFCSFLWGTGIEICNSLCVDNVHWCCQPAYSFAIFFFLVCLYLKDGGDQEVRLVSWNRSPLKDFLKYVLFSVPKTSKRFFFFFTKLSLKKPLE